MKKLHRKWSKKLKDEKLALKIKLDKFSEIFKNPTNLSSSTVFKPNSFLILFFLYLLFGMLAIRKDKNSWVILLFDVIIGLLAFLHFHYTEGNFGKL